MAQTPYLMADGGGPGQHSVIETCKVVSLQNPRCNGSQARG